MIKYPKFRRNLENTLRGEECRTQRSRENPYDEIVLLKKLLRSSVVKEANNDGVENTLEPEARQNCHWQMQLECVLPTTARVHVSECGAQQKNPPSY